MINNILTEGYFNSKTKRDSVSIEDTRTMAAGNFIQNLCNDIREDNIILHYIDINNSEYYASLSELYYRDTYFSVHSVFSNIADPVQFLFYCICGMILGKGTGSVASAPIYKIEVYRKSDPDSILFKIDDHDCINDFYSMQACMKQVNREHRLSVSYEFSNPYDKDSGLTVLSAKSIRTESAYKCYSYSLDIIPEFINYMKYVGIGSHPGRGSAARRYKPLPERSMEFYTAFQNALDKESEMHQGKPSLINVLKSTLASERNLFDMMKDCHAKMSDCISSQLPVRIDIIPTIIFAENMYKAVNGILKEFPDTFSEGSALPDRDDIRIII